MVHKIKASFWRKNTSARKREVEEEEERKAKEEEKEKKNMNMFGKSFRWNSKQNDFGCSI